MTHPMLMTRTNAAEAQSSGHRTSACTGHVLAFSCSIFMEELHPLRNGLFRMTVIAKGTRLQSSLAESRAFMLGLALR